MAKLKQTNYKFRKGVNVGNIEAELVDYATV